MLLLIGLGLSTKDISVRALEAIKNADMLRVDTYTSTVSEEYMIFLTEATGKEIKVAKRSDLEENAKDMVSDASRYDVALLVPGDPLIATTHHTILDEAARRGVKYAIYHAPSIFSAAIGESGLDIYKFGPTTTIPFWSEKYRPTSFLDVIKKNKENKEHTLVLLDYDQKENRSMDIGTAIKLLESAEAEKSYGILEGSTRILILGNIGREDKLIAYSSVDNAKGLIARFAGKTISLIVPAETNFAEEEALKRFITSST